MVRLGAKSDRSRACTPRAIEVEGADRVNLELEAKAEAELDARGRMMEGTFIPNILVDVVYVCVCWMLLGAKV